MNLIQNGNFESWAFGTSFTIGSGTSSAPIVGDWSYIATGAQQPSVTISRQRFDFGETLSEGAPRFFLQFAPGSAPTSGDLVAAYLKYVVSDDLTLVNRIGTLSFWANCTIDREIVVQTSREFVDGTGPGGVEEVVCSTTSFQLRAGWRKYQVAVRFPAFTGATHGISDVTNIKVFFQGDTDTLDAEQIPWKTSTISLSQVSLVPYGISDFDSEEAFGTSAGGSSTLGTALNVISDFGAVGDGVTNDTLALQTAITTAATVNKPLFFPKGNYLTDQLTHSSGTLLIYGEGELKSYLTSRSTLDSTSGWINISGVSTKFFARDMTFDGASKTLRNIRVNPSVEAVFLNCSVIRAFGSGAAVDTTCGIAVNGGGRFKFLGGKVATVTATANGISSGDAIGTARGISIFQSGAAEAPPIEVLISDCSIEDVTSGATPNEDADGIAYQSWGQTTLGNVKINNVFFYQCGKRWVKALSPGGIISNCDGHNDRPSTNPMYAAFSINTSDWKVVNNRAVNGARSMGCDVGNPGTWSCQRVTVSGNTFGQGADPSVSHEGVRVLGDATYTTTGVVVANNTLTSVLLGVHVSGVVGCVVEGNYIEATETGIHIGQRYGAESAYPDSSRVVVNGNTGTATVYGVRWKHAANCATGFNTINAPTPTISEQDSAVQFQAQALYNLNVVNGTLKNFTQILTGSATATTLPAVAVGGTGSFTPQIQSLSNTEGGHAAVCVGVIEGTNNFRAGFYANDTTGLWGLDSTFTTGMKPFVVTQAGVEWLRITNTQVTPAFSIVPNSGNALNIGAAGVMFASGFFQTGLQVGRATFGTGTLTFANISHAFLNTFKSSTSQAASWDYVLPADAPVAGDALRVTSVVGSTVTLEWAP